MFSRSFDRKTVITRNGAHYLVSTVSLPFGDGFETMIFACNVDGEVTDWGDLYCDRHDDGDAANAGHDRAVAAFAG